MKNNFENTPKISSKLEKKPWNESLDFIDDTELRHAIRKYVSDPENFLGEGGVGTVFTLEDKCIKIIKNRHNSKNAGAMDLGNDVVKEFEIQSRLDKIEFEGVSSPRTLSYFSGGEYSAIVMERLDATNLEHALKGMESFPEIFDAEDFMIRLESYIAELHDIGIAHNDLAARNVMIDKKTGMPRVIDFGRSIIAKSEKDDKFKLAKMKDETDLETIADGLGI